MGLNLEKLIHKKGLKISHLAKDIGVSPKTLSEWIGAAGRFPSNPNIIKRLSIYFKISVHELMFGGHDPLANPNMIELNTNSITAVIQSGLYQIKIERLDHYETSESTVWPIRT